MKKAIIRREVKRFEEKKKGVGAEEKKKNQTSFFVLMKWGEKIGVACALFFF